MMWPIIGLVLLIVSVPLLAARYSLPYGTEAKGWIEQMFFGGENIFAKDFRYAYEVTWLQWPALGVGILEELPGNSFVHALELAIPVAIYVYTKYKGGTPSAA